MSLSNLVRAPLAAALLALAAFVTTAPSPALAQASAPAAEAAVPAAATAPAPPVATVAKEEVANPYGLDALSIILQSLLTKWLALHLHYLVANVIAIVLASVVNFIANDKLTFRRRRKAMH